MKHAPTPEELYQSLVTFCRQLGIKPPSFDKWLTIREHLLKNYYPTIS